MSEMPPKPDIEVLPPHPRRASRGPFIDITETWMAALGEFSAEMGIAVTWMDAVRQSVEVAQLDVSAKGALVNAALVDAVAARVMSESQAARSEGEADRSEAARAAVEALSAVEVSPEWQGEEFLAVKPDRSGLMTVPRPLILRPACVSPASGAVGVLLNPTLTATPYGSLYGVSMAQSRWLVARDQQMTQIVADVTLAGTATEYALDDELETDQLYWWSVEYEDALGNVSARAEPAHFFTADMYVVQPVITSPSPGEVNVGETPVLTSSAFAVFNGSDSHEASQWRIYRNGVLVHDSGPDTTNLTAYEVPGGALVEGGVEHEVEVLHAGAALGWSLPSTRVQFVTAPSFGGDIGVPGQQGFGVGIYPGSLPSGFSEMTGTKDPTHANYGNYQYSDGSICCFVPKFYYRIAHAGNPTHATYGVNSIDIRSTPADGYVLHRAFINAGQELNGFFFDKYSASKNGNTAGRSVKNGVPISLTTSTSYTRSDGMTGCTGILADAVVLSRARGAGWQCASVFQWSAIRMLSLAHAQAATSATHCAWYDSAGTKNYPKGCNNGALADVDDASVTYTTAGDAGTSAKPLTGSGSPFAKTTHNGQSNGIADVNGGMWELAIGATMPGTSATDTTQLSGTSMWILKPSVDIATLTGGWNGATDLWRNAAGMGALYDQVNIGLAHNVNQKFGNGANQVLSGAASGQGYATDSLGLPRDSNAHSAAGTNLFGVDQYYMYYRANLAPLVCGAWNNAADAGVWSSSWNVTRSNANNHLGFRSAFGA